MAAFSSLGKVSLIALKWAKPAGGIGSSEGEECFGNRGFGEVQRATSIFPSLALDLIEEG
jgi:hypothetical protein